MNTGKASDLVRKYYAAYEANDRKVVEALLSDDFRFTSPYDDHIDRATYFKKCWPNSENIRAFRIDTLKFIPANFERTFGNAMREFALSAGKKNFFTFGEVYDNEVAIAEFIGRNASINSDMMGVDASLDFPLFFTLPAVAKGQAVAIMSLVGWV